MRHRICFIFTQLFSFSFASYLHVVSGHFWHVFKVTSLYNVFKPEFCNIIEQFRS
jgi:hypothetical protein